MNAMTLQTLLHRLPKPSDRDALVTAHLQAAAFHEAWANALEAQGELAGDQDYDGRVYWEKSYRESLGEAAVAMERMPVLWTAVLGVKVEAMPVNVPAVAAE